MRRLIFLHIQKTAGTSFTKSVIEPNMTCRVLVGFRREAYSLRMRPVTEECLHGHVAHGLHRFLNEGADYVTLLREPIDRMISHYYFVREHSQRQRLDIWQRHPEYDYFHSVSIGEVFENPRFSNLQTRRLAGMEFDRAYPYLSRCQEFRRAMLRTAMRHLDEMPTFGLQEQFEESQRRFLQHIRGGQCVTVPREKQTHERPTVAELGELHPTLLGQLRAANDLDVELHRYATERFARSPSLADPARVAARA